MHLMSSSNQIPTPLPPPRTETTQKLDNSP